MSVPFGPLLALDPTTNLLVKNASGSVYAVGDTTFATPLAVTDAAGVTLPTVNSGDLGILDEFNAPDGNLQVWWKSGSYVILLSSFKGIIDLASQALTEASEATAVTDALSGAIGDAQQAATDATAAAASAAASAAAAASNNNSDGTPTAGGGDPIRLRYGPVTEWVSQNPLLLKGQPGISVDESVTPTAVVVKIGNGVDRWNTLDDQVSGSGGGGGGGGNWNQADFTTLGLALAQAASATAARSSLGLAYLLTGSGSPEGAVTASVGSIYTRTNGTAEATLYVKESGTGSTGWAAKGNVATKSTVGLSNVDNTSDANKPVSTAQQAKFDQRAMDVYYTGSAWPSRPADAPSYGLNWKSTLHVAAPGPSAGTTAAHDGDLWWRHPDAT